MALTTALGVLVYLPIVVLGAWHLATGRAFPPGVPWSLPNGLPIRLFGLVSLIAAIAIIFFILHNSVSWTALGATYFFAIWSVVAIALRVRRQRAGRSQGAPPSALN